MMKPKFKAPAVSSYSATFAKHRQVMQEKNMKKKITLPKHFSPAQAEKNFADFLAGEVNRHFGYEVKVFLIGRIILGIL